MDGQPCGDVCGVCEVRSRTRHTSCGTAVLNIGIILGKSTGAAARVVEMLSRWLPVAPRAHVPPPGIVCPRCDSRTGDLSLLTGYTVYYACSSCMHRWSIAVPPAGAEGHLRPTLM